MTRVRDSVKELLPRTKVEPKIFRTAAVIAEETLQTTSTHDDGFEFVQLESYIKEHLSKEKKAKKLHTALVSVREVVQQLEKTNQQLMSQREEQARKEKQRFDADATAAEAKHASEMGEVSRKIEHLNEKVKCHEASMDEQTRRDRETEKTLEEMHRKARGRDPDEGGKIKNFLVVAFGGGPVAIARGLGMGKGGLISLGMGGLISLGIRLWDHESKKLEHRQVVQDADTKLKTFRSQAAATGRAALCKRKKLEGEIDEIRDKQCDLEDAHDDFIEEVRSEMRRVD